MSTAAGAELWTPTTEPPPENLVVDTMSDGGLQRPLKRRGRLWFYPDGSMYVYYTPKFWRPLVEARGKARLP